MLNHKRQILLCRPQGGLNDMLNRIGLCCDYADKHSCTVVVETDFSTAVNFKDEFGLYFYSHDKSLLLSSKFHIADFDKMTVEPAAFLGKINSYEIATLDPLAEADISTGLIPKIDFNRSYDAQLLLYHAAGGGKKNAVIALKRLSVTNIVRDRVMARLAVMGESFTSIHIRNTDYKTDFKQHLTDLKGKIVGPIFLATDSKEVLDFGRSVLGATNVYNFANLQESNNEPLHLNLPKDSLDINADAIADLLLLALAKKYYFFAIVNPEATWHFSGFSRLAECLHKHPKLLRELLNPRANRGLSNLRLVLHKKISRIKFLGQQFINSRKNHPR